MTQLGLEGMPRRLFACTPSRLTTWVDCPRRYRMTYLDRPAPARGGPWAHTSLGAAVHLALARWWDLAPGRRTPGGARALLDTAWRPDGFRDPAQSERWRLRSGDAVESYAATLDPAAPPLAVERTVALKTPVLAVSGRVDRLDERDGEVVVVDYKTSRRPPTVHDARGSLQLALYALAAARTLRRRCTTVELHHLPTGQVVRAEHDDASLARHLRRAEAYGQEAADAAEELADGGDPEVLFPPRPGAQCGFCDLARHCPEGRAARPPRRSWDGLGEDEAAA